MIQQPCWRISGRNRPIGTIGRRRCFLVMTKADENKREPKPDIPAPGPHARPELTDPEKTPGTGMLPSLDDTNPSPTS